jgi:ABC-type siderophore export system fused ATPase/permease subunit
MTLIRKNFLFLLNFLLFLLVGLVVFLDSNFAIAFCLVGFLFNLFLFFKKAPLNSIVEAEMINSKDELNLHEKDQIMEDLDREVTRRRETEQFNKN